MNDKLYDTYQKASGSVMIPADVYSALIAENSKYQAAFHYIRIVGQRLADEDRSYLHEAIDVINTAFMIVGLEQIIMKKEKQEI